MDLTFTESPCVFGAARVADYLYRAAAVLGFEAFAQP
jgi:hypothetical protein